MRAIRVSCYGLMVAGVVMTCTGLGCPGPQGPGGVADWTGESATGSRDVAAQQAEPPVCNAGGPYAVQCQGLTTTIALDGTGGVEPDGSLTYQWTSDCPKAAFDDETSPTPALTVDTSAGCAAACTVTLTVSDGVNDPVTCSADVSVADNAEVVFTTAAEDLVVECDGAGNTADLEAWLGVPAAESECGEVTITDDFVELSDDCGATGSATVTWTGEDACGNTATVSATFTIEDTQAPIIELNGDEAITLCRDDPYEEPGAAVVEECDTALVEAVVGGDVVDTATVGTYVVTYDATDDCGNAAEQVMRTVEVIEPEPPVVTVGDPIRIWPPNHKYVTLKLSDCATAESVCEGPLDIDEAGSILSLTSDEPDDANGDGRTTDDAVIVDHSTFKVRAERAGTGDGRVYSLVFEVTDGRGLTTEATCVVEVWHDQSGR